MSANQPTSFRFPFNLTDKVHPEAEAAMRYAFSGLKDLNDAIRVLNTKVNTNTASIAGVTGGVVTNVITGGGGTSGATHSEPLTDGQGNFIFAAGDIVVATGVLG